MAPHKTWFGGGGGAPAVSAATLAVGITAVDNGGSDIKDWFAVGDDVAQTFQFSSGR